MQPDTEFTPPLVVQFTGEKGKEERSHMDMPHVKGDCDGLADRVGALACSLTVVVVVNATKSGKTSCSQDGEGRFVLQCKVS